MLTDLNTALDAKRSPTRLAILPVGATEQHGPHLPLATDSLIAEAVGRRVARELKAYCLPTLPFSISQMHRGHRGTVWLRNPTLVAVIRDLATSLFAEGFRQLAILNCHGGNHILRAVVQDLNLDFPRTLTMSINIWEPAYAAGLFGIRTGVYHADEFETACMLYLHPGSVHRRQIRDHAPPVDGDALLYRSIGKIVRHGTIGCPSRATAQKGRQAFDRMVRDCVRKIRQTTRLRK